MIDTILNTLANVIGQYTLLISYIFGYTFVLFWFFSLRKRYNVLKQFDMVFVITLSLIVGFVIYTWAVSVYGLVSSSYKLIKAYKADPNNIYDITDTSTNERNRFYALVLLAGLLYLYEIYAIRNQISKPIFYIKKIDGKLWKKINTNLSKSAYLVLVILFSSLIWGGVYNSFITQPYDNFAYDFLLNLFIFSFFSCILIALTKIFILYFISENVKHEDTQPHTHQNKKDILLYFIIVNMVLFIILFILYRIFV